MDNLSEIDRHRTMQNVKSSGSKIERMMQSALAGSRLHGWKCNYKNVIGCPDFVFLEKKVAIFIDGCFWHGCPICNRPLPKTNIEYWQKKISRNINRDRDNNEILESQGWIVIRIWEHEIIKNEKLTAIIERVRIALIREDQTNGFNN